MPVQARQGDVVLAHYLLVHSPGAHRGPHIRYCVFFRLAAEHHDDLGDCAYTDAWAAWPGMRTRRR